MDEQLEQGQFLGLPSLGDGGTDVAVLSLPYELTTSYGQGTAKGPAACIEASAQVETYDPLLPDDLPAGFNIETVEPWDGEGGTLLEQLNGIEEYCRQWMDGSCFPLVLGGEHGSLPAEIRALAEHPDLGGDLSQLTVIQFDAHADLRDEMDGEPFSHACAARRALDEGVGRLMQVGVRAFSREEANFITENERVSTWFARDLLSPCTGEHHWEELLDSISALEGPVWLTLDVDGLDGSLVPATGTPVPGGLAFWQAVGVIEALFAAPEAHVLGADVVEIVPGVESPLTQFTAAMLATKVVAAHLARRIRLEVEA